MFFEYNIPGFITDQFKQLGDLHCQRKHLRILLFAITMALINQNCLYSWELKERNFWSLFTFAVHFLSFLFLFNDSKVWFLLCYQYKAGKILVKDIKKQKKRKLVFNKVWKDMISQFWLNIVICQHLFLLILFRVM